MIYLYYFIGFILGGEILHLVIKKLAANVVSNYLFQANNLLRARNYTDGCSTPFKTYIHRWLKKSYDLCAAHDYGSLGLIYGVQGGYHNNFVTWLAHMSQAAPVYWVWGTIVATVTLPWVVWRRNFNQTWVAPVPFHIALLSITIGAILIYLFSGF